MSSRGASGDVAVLHRGSGYAIVDKPSGLAVVAERRRPGETPLLDAIAAALGSERILVVHRLDRETSGALVVATDEAAHRDLSIQFEKRRVSKEYLALIAGVLPAGDERTIDAPLEKDPSRPGHMRVARGGRPGAKRALTRVRGVERFRGHSLVLAMPTTGRLHQIRVHLRHAGFPLAVDPDYGAGTGLFLSDLKGHGYRRAGRDRAEAPLLGRVSLHARALELRDPATGATVRAESPLPADFERAIAALRRYSAHPD